MLNDLKILKRQNENDKKGIEKMIRQRELLTKECAREENDTRSAEESKKMKTNEKKKIENEIEGSRNEAVAGGLVETDVWTQLIVTGDYSLDDMYVPNTAIELHTEAGLVTTGTTNHLFYDDQDVSELLGMGYNGFMYAFCID